MADDKSEPSGFKVVDRRNFSADGTRREASKAEEQKPRPSSPSTPASRPSPPSPATELEEDLAAGAGGGFETLVSYLSTTAMFQLGLLPGPSGERIPVDMVNARRTIDLLEVLSEKTRGNLTAQESQLLADVLYELRMTFVELEKRAQKGK
jgi:hypothetical protein